MTYEVTAGQRHEASVFETLMNKGAVNRVGPGRPRLYPGRIVGDKGYSSGYIRRFLHRRGIRVTIARRKDEGVGACLTKPYIDFTTWWNGSSTA